jgi:hypothetical protein
MRARWMIIPLVLLLPAVAFAQKARGNDREAVVQAERQWADATVRCDTIALARMFSDSLVYVHTNGVADTKAGYMKKLSACAVERVEPVTKPATGTQGLLGTWRLLEYWDRDSIGAPKRDVYGTQPCGYLIYARRTTVAAVRSVDDAAASRLLLRNLHRRFESRRRRSPCRGRCRAAKHRHA